MSIEPVRFTQINTPTFVLKPWTSRTREDDIDDEDPETEFFVFADRGLSGPSGEGGGTSSFISQSFTEAGNIASLLGTLPKSIVQHIPKSAQSFKHLTLPEALIYTLFLDGEDLSDTLSAKLKARKKPTFNHPVLYLDLVIEKKDKTTILYGINYDYRLLSATITEAEHSIGDVRYIMRDRKLEEIDGRFRGKPLLLDPVWNPIRKKDLKEEYFRYGTASTCLSYFQNEKHAVFHISPSRCSKMSVKSINESMLNKDTVFTRKTVKFSNFEGFVSLFFSRGTLIPTAGLLEFNQVKDH